MSEQPQRISYETMTPFERGEQVDLQKADRDLRSVAAGQALRVVHEAYQAKLEVSPSETERSAEAIANAAEVLTWARSYEVDTNWQLDDAA